MPSKDPRDEKLRKMYDEARAVKDVIEKDWTGARDMIRGNQMPPNRPAHKPPAVLNLLRPLIERKTAMMTDTKPRFSVLPTGSGNKHSPQAAKLLDEAVNAWWDDFSMDIALMRGLLYAQGYGVMITNTRWSKTKGNIVVDMIDPKDFYVDPYITSTEQLSDAEYVIHEELPVLEDVKMTFGSKAAEVKPWTPPASGATSESWGARLSKIFRGSAKPAPESAIRRTLLRHYWIKDYSYEDLEVTDTETGKTKTVRRRKYPGGRYMIWAHDGIILHDEPNPYLDAIHPFDMMDWYQDLDGPWGDGEVFAQKNPQLLLNKLAEVIVENTMLMNNAIWIADKTAFPATDGPDGWGQLTNVPGQIVKKRPGTDVRREYPQGVPNSALTLLQHLEQFIESRGGGFPEILSKGKAGNVQSGLGIEQLQMSASAMIRLKARALEGLIDRVGQKIISRIIQFYTKDRVMHILGPKEEYQEYLFVRKHFTEALGPEGLKDAHRDFRFRTAPGSSLSMTRIQKGLVAVQLYQMGCIDRQAILEAVEFPDWENVLKRTLKEQALGIEPAGQKQKGTKKGPVERQQKIAGRI